MASAAAVNFLVSSAVAISCLRTSAVVVGLFASAVAVVGLVASAVAVNSWPSAGSKEQLGRALHATASKITKQNCKDEIKSIDQVLGLSYLRAR